MGLYGKSCNSLNMKMLLFVLLSLLSCNIVWGQYIDYSTKQYDKEYGYEIYKSVAYSDYFGENTRYYLEKTPITKFQVDSLLAYDDQYSFDVIFDTMKMTKALVVKRKLPFKSNEE